MQQFSRRQMLGVLGGVAACGAIAATGGISRAADAPPGPFALVKEPFSWKPMLDIDPAQIQSTAYQGYDYKGYGCCFGVFYSILGLMGEKHGKPYSDFPYAVWEVGKSGISDWGTICGALLGGAAALAMFWGRKERDPLVDQLFRWYETTALPIYKPAKANFVEGDIQSTTSGSVLCHASVSKWAYTTGLSAASKERSERCGRVTADVALKTWEIITLKATGKEVAGFGKSESRTFCGGCHDKDKESPISKGKMDCTPCHSGSEHTLDKFKNHP